jgi:hypothetical protein
MQREDREPLWITPDRVRERPTIRRLERPQRLAHQSSIAFRLGLKTRLNAIRAYELIADKHLQPE